MEKPITMVIDETKNSIITAINRSGLPAFILEMIIKDIYNEISQAANSFAENERKIYNDSVKVEQVETEEDMSENENE